MSLLRTLLEIFRCSCIASAGIAAVPAPSAEVFIRSIYGKAYIGHDSHGIGVDSQVKLERYFVADLARTINDDWKSSLKKDEVSTMDGDPFIDAQDWDIAAFKIAVQAIDTTHAAATAHFRNT